MKRRPLSILQIALLFIGGLSLAALILRTLSVCLYLDADIGYFQSGRGTVITVYVLEALAALSCLALPFLIKRESAPRIPTLSMAGLVGTGSSALLLMVNAIYLLLRLKHLPAPFLLVLLCAFLSAVGAGYFATQFRGGSDSTVPCTYGMILACACMVALTYFDRYTQMNAPHKLSLHLALLAVMLATLFDLRARLGKDYPRARIATEALAFFFCLTVGLSNTVGFLTGAYRDLTYLFQDLLCLALALYYGARVFDVAMHSTSESKEEAQ